MDKKIISIILIIAYVLVSEACVFYGTKKYAIDGVGPGPGPSGRAGSSA